MGWSLCASTTDAEGNALCAGHGHQKACCTSDKVRKCYFGCLDKTQYVQDVQHSSNINFFLNVQERMKSGGHHNSSNSKQPLPSW